jgi:hypothetical protein
VVAQPILSEMAQRRLLMQRNFANFRRESVITIGTACCVVVHAHTIILLCFFRKLVMFFCCLDIS